MFKPTLKRSKAGQIANQVRIDHSKYDLLQPNDKAILMQKVQNPVMYIPPFLSKSSGEKGIKKENKIICPLSYWDIGYPYEVKQKLNLPIQNVKSRLVGVKFGIFWFVTEKQLHLWRYDSVSNPTVLQLHRKFQFQQNIRVVSIGHLNKHDCQFFSFPPNSQVLAIGFKNIIDLYSIDMITLEVRSLQIRLKVQFNQGLEMLQITQNNQILFTSSLGFLTRVSFDGYDRYGYPKIHKSIGRPNTLPKVLTLSGIFTRNNTRIYTEKILRSIGGKIYVLLRKQSEGSMIHRLGLRLRRFFQGKIKIDETALFIEKQINVYKIRGEEKGIIFESKISNEDIEKKLKDSFSSKNKSDVENLENKETNNIITIFMDKSNQNLKVATSSGLFLSLRENTEATYSYNSFSFSEGPKLLPTELYMKPRIQKSNGVFMRNDQEQREEVEKNLVDETQPLLQKSNKLISSWGDNGLNLMSNGLCFYYNEKQIQIVKLQKQPGHIVEGTLIPSQQASANNLYWFIFYKSEILLIRKIELYEHIITTLESTKDVNAQGIANGQKVQYYPQAKSVMKEIHCLLGHDQTCRQLFKALMYIYQNIVTSHKDQMSKIDPLFITGSEVKQSTIQDQKLKVKIAARLKYQNSLGQNFYRAFNRWFHSKSTLARPHIVKITQQIQSVLWSYLLIQQVERIEPSQYLMTQIKISTLQEKLWLNLPLFAQLMISTFQQYYGIAKLLTLTEIRKSPAKVTQMKNRLSSLLHFLQQKRRRSSAFISLHPMYQGPNRKNSVQQVILTKQSPKDLVNNQSLQDTSTSCDSNILNSKTYFTDKHVNVSSASQQIEKELIRVIPKIISLIQLYEILSANSQRKYEDLPTLEKSFTSFDARKKVKSALIDLFSTSDISIQETILKFNKSLPELRLQCDIFLAKWVKFISIGQQSKYFDSKMSLTSRIKVSNLVQLSKQLQIEHVLKIKQFFKQVQPLYVKILLDQLEWRKLELKVADRFIASQNKKISEAQNELINNPEGISIFQWDKYNSQKEWRGWLMSEILLIKNQINSLFQSISLSTQNSSASDNLEKEKSFDECTKITLQYKQEGIQFIKKLVEFLKEKKILAEKVYRLSMALNPNAKAMSVNMIENKKKSEKKASLVSSMSTIRELVKQKDETTEKSSNEKNEGIMKINQDPKL